MRALILTGGIRHDFADNAAAAAALLEDAGIATETTQDLDAGVARLATGDFDLTLVMALRWPMEGDPKYAPYRDNWAYHMPEETAEGLRRYVADGGGLFGLHTACLCFDDWAGWKDLLGGRWVWGQSFHPPRGPVKATPLDSDHALIAGLPSFEIEDEVFSKLDLAADVRPLMTGRAESEGGEEPILWARTCGHGRVVFDALGHDRGSIEHPVHRRIVQRCALWAGGAAAEAVTQV